LSGSIARSPFAAGEPIRENRLIKGAGSGYMAAILPTGMRAVSTDVTPETGAAGFILPNDRVDVILSRRDREAEKSAGIEVHSSETILTNVRVLAIDQAVEEKGGQRAVIGKTVTLELTQRQAETLVVSRTMGQLSLALRSLVDASGDKSDTTEERGGRRSGVSIVRFGVSTTTTPK
jgi:pilus assembly protein CpaB